MYLDQCPLCHDEGFRPDGQCARCGYSESRYNRAQDDVALTFHLTMSERARLKSPSPTWMAAIPAWCRSHWTFARPGGSQRTVTRR